MTDQELFERLKREGECWHEWEMAADIPICHHCRRECEPANFNPDFSTPDGFFWLWDHTYQREDEVLSWEKFNSKALMCSDKMLELPNPQYYVHRTRFTEALKQYLSGGVAQKPLDNKWLL